jgi:hypothetical protein
MIELVIHGTDLAGEHDSIVVAGETLEEVQKMALDFTEQRGWTDCWSEERK